MRYPSRRFTSNRLSILPMLTAVLWITADLGAVSPTPEAIAKWKTDGTYGLKVSQWRDFKATGGCAAATHSPFNKQRTSQRRASSLIVTDTINVLTILVDFPDYRFTDTSYQSNSLGGVSADSAMFDSLLYSDRDIDLVNNPTGSFTDYFIENTYGQLYLKGDVVGWLTMPKNYSHYEGGNSGLGSGGPELAGAAIDAANAAGVDFSKYDNDGDIFIEGVIVVHAGPGAETGAFGIWSHRSSTSTRFYDGVSVSAYTLNPEEQSGQISTVGVFCHEYGHILQLPDLYDLGSSGANGLGAWSLMASGNWNAPVGMRAGTTPAHMNSWSKERAGFMNIIDVTSNIEQAEIPQLESEPIAYRIRTNLTTAEYWLVENRQHVGFDFRLPGKGLLIYHVDDLGNQSNPDRYKVDLEQADGLRQLNTGGNNGDNADAWPQGLSKNFFSTFSTPNSDLNFGTFTEVGVWDISNSDSLMFADLDMTYSRPWLVQTSENSSTFSDEAPDGNGDGVLDQGETVSFDVALRNLGKFAYGSVAHLSSSSPDVQFITNDVSLSDNLNQNLSDLTLATPITFSIPVDAPSVVATFTLTITTDSADGSGDGIFVSAFEFSQTVGTPQILIVDDDNGATWERRYTETFDRLFVPYEVWEKQSAGSPAIADLSGFKHVFWFTGAQNSGGTIVSPDITAMKGFLNGGGNLMLSSVNAPGQIHAIDSAFMAGFFHTVKGNEVFSSEFRGFPESIVGDDKLYEYLGSSPLTGMQPVLTAVNGGAESFFMTKQSDPFKNNGVCGVTYDGAYKTIFHSFPFEFVGEGRLNFLPKDSLMAKVLQFFGGPQAPSCCLGSTGNIDCDLGGVVDITDLTVLIDHLFITLTPLCCMSAANADGAGMVDITDLTVMIDHLFISLQPTAPCN